MKPDQPETTSKVHAQCIQGLQGLVLRTGPSGMTGNSPGMQLQEKTDRVDAAGRKGTLTAEPATKGKMIGSRTGRPAMKGSMTGKPATKGNMTAGPAMRGALLGCMNDKPALRGKQPAGDSAAVVAA